MFESKKFKVAFISEMALPWLVAMFGIPAICFWQESVSIWHENAMRGIYTESDAYLRAETAFEAFYTIAMLCGFVAVAVLIIMGFVSLVLVFVRSSCAVRPPNDIARCVVILLCSPLCVLGTLLLMFVLLVLTYGQGV